MEASNQSSVTEFVLLGLSAHPKLEKTFFVLILSMYLVILLGNGVLILVTVSDSCLQTPMYFFLGNLSFLDICYTTSSVPLVLDGFLTPRKTIPFSACAIQMFLSFGMGATECVLLGMMAFDRYVAICNPLRYPVVMRKAVYVSMAASSWLAGGANSLVQISLAVQLPFCGDNVINHFTCEILAVLKLACADIFINVVSMGVANVIFLGVPVLFIFVSYIFILTTILRIPSVEGRKKGLLHLLCPPHCGGHLLWDYSFHVWEAQIQGPPGGRQAGTCRQTHLPLLWTSDPHAQPHHLQPQEQGC